MDLTNAALLKTSKSYRDQNPELLLPSSSDDDFSVDMSAANSPVTPVFQSQTNPAPTFSGFLVSILATTSCHGNKRAYSNTIWNTFLDDFRHPPTTTLRDICELTKKDFSKLFCSNSVKNWLKIVMWHLSWPFPHPMVFWWNWLDLPPL